MTQDFSAMTRRRSAGILGVFQALTTKSEPKKTSQIVQIIFEQCLKYIKKINPDLHTAPKQSIIKSLQIRSDIDEQSEQIKETNTVG